MEKEKVVQNEQLTEKELLTQIIKELQELKNIIFICHGAKFE